jgi:hypothetical protein
MGEEAQYIARYASVHITGESFTEVGDILAARGFDMTSATQTDQGVLVIPHRKRNRAEAHVFRQLPPVAPEFKPLDAPPLNGNGLNGNGHAHEPMSLGAAQVELVTAKVESGAVEPIGLQCGTCGAVHPEGVVCMIPVFYEKRCCLEHTFAHDGPHEAGTDDGQITHRWIEELVCTDLPFNAYGHYEDECDD